jgi:hydrogenase maturation protein HypF
VRAIPYDRANTSLAPFLMCPSCRAEYDDVLNRRFHAQPIACPACGPQIWLEGTDENRIEPERAIMAAAELIQQGEIVAIKGLGGIHLACDATHEIAVQRLRQGKHRYHKPFALMARDLAMIEGYCAVNQLEQTLLQSPAAPIVLLCRASELPCPLALAPNLPTLGFMLPYTPLHHLLLQQLDQPIVLTSGNLSDQPQCITNGAARAHLGAIASYFLLHDREIVNRVDDSVVRVVQGQVQVLRRARGYAPAPIALPPGFEAAAPVLAMGSELKNTVCLLRAGEAILSQHLGDLENGAAYTAYQETLALYQQLFEHRPTIIATDLHPDYLSTKLGQQLATVNHLSLYGIQHHHAHTAAVMAERGLPLTTGPVLGIALDGLGYGSDGTLWGGEFLKADYVGFQRLAHLQPVALLGGAQAMRQPWRNTYAQLAALGWERLQADYGDLELVQWLRQKPTALLDQMLAQGVQAPLASSAGRLFDAVAAALNCCRERASYEGQGAIELEALIGPADLAQATPYPFSIQNGQLSAQPLWPELLRDLQRGGGRTDRSALARSQLAANFHLGFAQALVALAQQLCQAHLLTTVVLSGGVFQNAILLTLVQSGLQALGLRVLIPQQVPLNDGGIALGQAVIAAAQKLRKGH